MMGGLGMFFIFLAVAWVITGWVLGADDWSEDGKTIFWLLLTGVVLIVFENVF